MGVTLFWLGKGADARLGLLIASFFSVFGAGILFWKSWCQQKKVCFDRAKVNDSSMLTEAHQHLREDEDLALILYRLLQKISSIEDRHQAYSQILKSAIEAVGAAEMGSILLKKGEYLYFECAVGLNEKELKKLRLKQEYTFLNVITEGSNDRTVICRDVSEYNRRYWGGEDLEAFVESGTQSIRSSMSAPIYLRNEFIGSINLDSTGVDAFNNDETKKLEVFAYEASRCIQLYTGIQENLMLSREDVMTKIYNRRYGTEIIKEFISNQSPFALALIDLNNFKLINDTCGHDEGDKYLTLFVACGKEVISQVKPFDISKAPQHKGEFISFIRYGGDEFLLLFSEDMIGRAEHLLEAIDDLFGRRVAEMMLIENYASFSYGIVEFPTEAFTYDELLQVVDQKMYKEKRAYHHEC